MRRPVAILALLYTAGLLLAEFLHLPLSVLWLLNLGVAGAALLWPQGRRGMLVVAVVLMGWLNLTLRTSIVSPNDLRLLLSNAVPAEVVLRGRLLETPSLRLFVRDDEESYRTLAMVSVEALATGGRWQPAHGQVLVLTPGGLSPDFFSGQRVEIAGIVSPPRTAVAPGLFDYQAHLRRQGVYFQLRAAASYAWAVVPPGLLTPPLADRFTQWAKGVLKRGLPDDESTRLLWAMTLGWRTALTNEVNEPFMRSGTMHIFAISGLHIALIAGILVSLLRVLQVSRAWCGLVVIPLIWFYTAATGWQPSAIRSTVMMTVIIGGWALRRPTDLLNSLAVAGLIILVWDPQQLFQASFQLSFFVVLSIALLLPPIEGLRDRLLKTDPFLPPELLPRWRRWLNGPLRWVTTAAATSLAAWLGSLPLTAYYFHLFSPVTLLANLVVVPLSSLALMCNLGGLLCGGWWPGVGELFNHSAWLWMWAMIRASELATQLPGAFAYVRSFSPSELTLYYGLLAGTLSGWLFASQRRRWTMPAVGAALMMQAVLWFQQSRMTALTAIPLSGGHAVYCDARGRTGDALVDCGQTNAVEFVVTPFLRAQGVNTLPHLLLTHGDLQQMGGAELVMRDFRVRQVLASPVTQLSPTYRRVMAELRQTPDRLRLVQRGAELAPWSVLHPLESDRFRQGDDNAVVLFAKLHETRVLLLSDLGRPGQEALLERESDLRADIVIAGLPAQGEPLCDGLLDRIQPQVIVVMDAEFPATQRASPQLRERLSRRGATVLCTRETGAVQLTVRGRQWRLQTMRGDHLTSKNRPDLRRSPNPQSDDVRLR
jgi:ComEC/Rec2-related protein